MISSRKQEAYMKHIATMALMLNLAIASLYAQQTPVIMTFSGTAAATTINLGTNTPTTEYNLSGNGMFGQFTFRMVSAGGSSPQQSSACPSPKLYFLEIAGGGVFRFEDGSLLNVHLTGGDDCIDLSTGQARCTRMFQITGGTGRFRGASGALTLTMTDAIALADPNMNPVLITATGQITGPISGVTMGQGPQGEQQ